MTTTTTTTSSPGTPGSPLRALGPGAGQEFMSCLLLEHRPAGPSAAMAERHLITKGTVAEGAAVPEAVKMKLERNAT